jgi:enoyl-CoA hydratase/carnithine racemase
MKETRAVITEQSGPIVWLTLSRPEKANALDRKAVEQLLEALNEAEGNEAARVLILTGAGPNFCAGADLLELLNGGPAGVLSLLNMLRELLMRLERSRLITIAAVQGAARAGGLEMALACDVIVAARSSTFGDAHLAIGLLPGGGSTVRLPRAIGWQRAKWLILSGASIDADTASNWGLVFQVVGDADLKRLARTIGESLMRGASEVIERAKGLLAMVSEQPLSASLDAEIATLQAHYHSTAFQEGIKDFLRRE